MLYNDRFGSKYKRGFDFAGLGYQGLHAFFVALTITGARQSGFRYVNTTIFHRACVPLEYGKSMRIGSTAPIASPQIVPGWIG